MLRATWHCRRPGRFATVLAQLKCCAGRAVRACNRIRHLFIGLTAPATFDTDRHLTTPVHSFYSEERLVLTAYSVSVPPRN
jgi:hypothetical protein